jgi:hypothetical protein
MGGELFAGEIARHFADHRLFFGQSHRSPPRAAQSSPNREFPHPDATQSTLFRATATGGR